MQAPRRDRLGLAFEGQRSHRLGGHGMSDKSMGLLADQDLAVLGHLLQACGSVHDVTGGESLVGCRIASHDFAGVDPGADGELDSPTAGKIAVQGLEGGSHVERSPHGAQRVVLVELGDAEDRHHRVPNELLDCSLMPFNRDAHRVEVPLHDLSQGFGIKPFAHLRRTCDVREEHRHPPSGLECPFGGRLR